MKILIINFQDGGGGGAIAPRCLYEGLKKKGIDVDFAVIKKQSADENIICIERKRTFFIKVFQKLAHYLEKFLFKNFKTKNAVLHSLNLYSKCDINLLNESDYDIIHLHWIAANTISIKDIAKITKPLVWTMHDCWAVCGAEHYVNIQENDKRYIDGYTKNNRANNENGFDLCRWIFNKKKKYFKMPIQFIGPSKWQTQICKDSFIFKQLPKSSATNIPNVLDKNSFYPIDKKTAKNILVGKTEKVVLMFSTPYFANPETDIKGSGLLIKALEIFFKNKSTDDFILLMTGNINTEVKKLLPKNVQTMFTGFIQNPRIMNLAYNACDILLFPSRIENLPYGLLEPQATGSPCVAFDTGGNSDIVLHKKTGYLAPCFDVEDFAMGIEFCLKHKDELSANAIKHIKINFDSDEVINKHIELYKRTLEVAN